jgi:hypothetical protein
VSLITKSLSEMTLQTQAGETETAFCAVTVIGRNTCSVAAGA